MIEEDEEFSDGDFDYLEFLEDEDDLDDLVIDPTRALLPIVVARTIAQLRRKLRKGRRDLKALSLLAARAKWAFEDAKHEAMKRVSGANPDMRKANAMTAMHPNKQTGQLRKVTHLGYDMDKAEKLWRSQQQIVASLSKELEALRSLLVTARDEAKD